MKKEMNDFLPDINLRIKTIIDDKFGGNVSKFAQAIGYHHSSRVNRLFNISPRNGQYPEPSIGLIIDISERLGYSTDFLLKGKEDKRRTVNNIDINNSKHTINGNSNTIGNDNNVGGDSNNNMMMSMIQMLQEQNKVLQKQVTDLTEMLKDNQRNVKNVPLT